MTASLFDPDDPPVAPRPPTEGARLAQEARDLGLAQVEANAPDEWKAEAWAFLCRYVESHREVFVDDLWAAGLPRPHEARALGAVVLRAARQGLVVPTGRHRPSTASRGGTKPVWRSTRCS